MTGSTPALGLLDPGLADLDLEQTRNRERLARHFVQRRRRDIRHFLDEETPFPRDRQTRDVPYRLAPQYKEFHARVLDYARNSVAGTDGDRLGQRVRWWSALALLRSVASSPAAAAATLRTRASAAGAATVAEADELGPADRALRQGVLQGYRETEEALPVVRGRIRMGDQLHRRSGFPLPVEVRYDDYTVDIAENRLLRAAAERLLRLPGMPAGSRTGLHRVLARLAGVASLVPGGTLPAWWPTRLNVRYHVALGLAELVLRGASYELDDGTRLWVDGLLVDMPLVFERFVTVALAEALRPYGGYARLQDPAHHFDRAQRLRLRPDLVWYREAAPVGVIDAKYKVGDEAGVPSADLYQMLAYCTVLGLPRGHLVYAQGAAEPRRHVVRRSGTEITCHAVDLSAPPDALLARMRIVAGHIARAE